MSENFFCFVLILVAGCTAPTVDELMRTDREFSARSAEAGMKKAFLEYADDTLVLLRPGSMPLIGRHAMEQSYKAFSDEGFVLTWEPAAGDISGSGDLGYTYGYYTMTLKADSSMQTGTYLSIWKKQPDGSWKFVLDTGNEGLE